MNTFKTVNIILLLATLTYADQEESCVVFDEENTQFLGTKTPYRIIVNGKDSMINHTGCVPVKIIGVIRHGTRTPGRKTVKKIRKSLDKIKEELRKIDNTVHESDCELGLDRIKNWKFKVENEEEKVLTSEGEEEMLYLAERLKKQFPSILSKKYENSSFHFRFTDTQRTRESAKYFTLGLFGEEDSKSIWYPEATYKDPLLRFYKLCDKWREEVKKNASSFVELKKYLLSDEVGSMIGQISSRIGLNRTLDYEEIHLMYSTCAYETAWDRSIQSPWCALFSRRDLKVMEYTEDLKYYWRDGYGFHINHDQACPLVQNIFSIFNSQDELNSVFYFTHSGTILKLLSHLGLYKDEFKLTHNLENILKDKRKWKVSKVDSFSTNIIFVLYRCDDDLKVQLLHQERTVTIPGCPEGNLCSLNLLENIYNGSFQLCDFNSICSIKTVV